MTTDVLTVTTAAPFKDLASLFVGEVMTTQVVTVRPDATVADAAWLMDRHHVTCLPVVDDAGQLRGIVSPRDLLRVFLRPVTHGGVDAEDLRYAIDDSRIPAGPVVPLD
jgi:CBS-domain-containing membrane protein